jgi:hypothetical protein
MIARMQRPVIADGDDYIDPFADQLSGQTGKCIAFAAEDRLSKMILLPST